jgi:hypothetical protein
MTVSAPGASGVALAATVSAVTNTGASPQIQITQGQVATCLVGSYSPKPTPIPPPAPAPPQPTQLANPPPPLPIGQDGRPIGGATACNCNGISVAVPLPPPPPPQPQPQQAQPTYAPTVTLAAASGLPANLTLYFAAWSQ